jgi:hypothetical protein
MCGGYRWTYWATGVPGWMRGGGAGSPGWVRHGHGPEPGSCCGHGHEPGWAEVRSHGSGRCRCESTAEDELAFLKEEADGLRHYLEGIERRISELQKMGS